MTIFAFLLGLGLGIGLWLWRQARLYRQIRQMLDLLDSDTKGISLPLVSRLRRGIVLANQHRQDLESQLQVWQQLIQAAPVGYLQVDEENQVLWCNQQAQNLLHIYNWQPEETRLLLELVRSYELDRLIEQTRQRQQPSQQEWMFYPSCADVAAIGETRLRVGDNLPLGTAQHQRRSLHLYASSWPLPQGQVGVFLENRQPLVAISQSRERWVSDLAHELRTPLTSIRLVIETLQNRLEPPFSRWIERLLPEINRLITLVQDWLELSQMEEDPKKHLNIQPIELPSLIQSVWQTLEPLARSHQLNLDYSGPDSLYINGDESRLTQVFLNIFANAIKYSPIQATIKVKINLYPQQDAAEQIQIDIIDSGPGFAEFDLPHVFERLYRGDPARTRQSDSPVVVEEGYSPKTKSLTAGSASTQKSVNSSEAAITQRTTGSGLGLAIVKQIILAHGGSVEAKNHPETGGAWLQIKLSSP